MRCTLKYSEGSVLRFTTVKGIPTKGLKDRWGRDAHDSVQLVSTRGQRLSSTSGKFHREMLGKCPVSNTVTPRARCSAPPKHRVKTHGLHCSQYSILRNQPLAYEQHFQGKLLLLRREAEATHLTLRTTRAHLHVGPCASAWQRASHVHPRATG